MEIELERLTHNAKQMMDQLQATHANDLRAVGKRLKTDEVLFVQYQISSHLYVFDELCYMWIAVYFILMNFDLV